MSSYIFLQPYFDWLMVFYCMDMYCVIITLTLDIYAVSFKNMY